MSFSSAKDSHFFFEESSPNNNNGRFNIRDLTF